MQSIVEANVIIRSMSRNSGYQFSFDGVDSILMRNPDTGHWRFTPPPREALLEKYYNATFTRSTQSPSVESEFTQEILNKLRGLDSYLRTKGGFKGAYTFHDIGCGFGASVWAMQQFGNIATGNEANVEWVNKANLHCNGKLTAERIEDFLPKLNYTIDVFFTAHVLEHLIDPYTTIQTVSRFISKDGLLYICVPNAQCKPVSKKGILDPSYSHCCNFPMHLNYFTPKSMFYMLRQAGLDAIEVGTRSLFHDDASPDDCLNLLGFELFMLASPRSPKTIDAAISTEHKCNSAYQRFMEGSFPEEGVLEFQSIEFVKMSGFDY
jgi:SAM-dependent methyltransferase